MIWHKKNEMDAFYCHKNDPEKYINSKRKPTNKMDLWNKNKIR